MVLVLLKEVVCYCLVVEHPFYLGFVAFEFLVVLVFYRNYFDIGVSNLPPFV